MPEKIIDQYKGKRLGQEDITTIITSLCDSQQNVVKLDLTGSILSSDQVASLAYVIKTWT